MDLEYVKHLCKTGERNAVEYKTSTAALRSIFETICAFLNTQGGIVLVGVKDDGKIVGQHISDGTQKAIATEISKIEPAASVEVNYIPLESDRFVIAFHVKAESYAPYVYEGRAFQRYETKTQRMSQHRYEQLLVRRGQLNHSWERGVTTDYVIDDLDHDEIRRAVKQGISVGRVPIEIEHENIKNILKSWNLMHGEHLTHAAVILFAKEVLPYYTQCHIKMARFRGMNKQCDFIDNKDYFGNAFRIFEEANSFIMRHLPIASCFDPDSWERIDKPALPVLAVREALVNAICHCNYSNFSSAITLAIFDDRMEIWNKGQLPVELKIEHLKKKHQSEPPNKNIAKVFYDRKYFEGWGTGIVKIFDLCHEQKIPEPEYEHYSGGTEIVFRFKESIGSTTVPITIEDSLSKRQKQILTLIRKNGAMGIQKIMAELIEPPSQRMVRKDLTYLKEKGLLDIKGSARAILWVPK